MVAHFHYIYIYPLCRDFVAIRKYTAIKGKSIGSTECKLSQLADDTTLILDGFQKSLQRSLYMLERFGEISGLRVSCKKIIKAPWIGSSKESYFVPGQKSHLGKR